MALRTRFDKMDLSITARCEWISRKMGLVNQFNEMARVLRYMWSEVSMGKTIPSLNGWVLFSGNKERGRFNAENRKELQNRKTCQSKRRGTRG